MGILDFTPDELDSIHLSLVAYKIYLEKLGKDRPEVKSAIRKIEEMIVGNISAPEPTNPADYKVWEAIN